MTPTVVPLDSALLPAATSLFVEVFNSEPWNDGWTLDTAGLRLRDLLDTPGYAGSGLVGTDGEMLGLVGGYRQRWYDGWHFYIAEMAVARSRQRTGLGSLLLTTFLDSLDDIAGVYLLTERGGAASDFYERHGFRPAGRQVVMTRF